MSEKETSSMKPEMLLASAMESIRRQLRDSIRKQLAQELFGEDELFPLLHTGRRPVTDAAQPVASTEEDRGPERNLKERDEIPVTLVVRKS